MESILDRPMTEYEKYMFALDAGLIKFKEKKMPEEKKSVFGEALKKKEEKKEEQKAKFGEKMGDRTEKGMEGYCT